MSKMSKIFGRPISLLSLWGYLAIFMTPFITVYKIKEQYLPVRPTALLSGISNVISKTKNAENSYGFWIIFKADSKISQNMCLTHSKSCVNAHQLTFHNLRYKKHTVTQKTQNLTQYRPFALWVWGDSDDCQTLSLRHCQRHAAALNYCMKLKIATDASSTFLQVIMAKPPVCLLHETYGKCLTSNSSSVG